MTSSQNMLLESGIFHLQLHVYTHVRKHTSISMDTSTHQSSGCKAQGRRSSPPPSQQLSFSQSCSGDDPEATSQGCFLPSVIKWSKLPWGHFPSDAGTNPGPRTSSRVFARLLCLASSHQVSHKK